jgi:hypothetical protein
MRPTLLADTFAAITPTKTRMTFALHTSYHNDPKAALGEEGGGPAHDGIPKRPRRESGSIGLRFCVNSKEENE